MPWGSWTTSRGKCVPYPPLQIVNSIPFCLFSLYLFLLPFSIFSLLPLPHPFFLFWSILCLPKIKTSNFITFCFTNGTFFCILFHTMTFFNNAFYKLVKTKFWCMSSNLSCPEDLKKHWLHRRVGSRNSNKGWSLRPSFSSNYLLVSFSILSLLLFLISPSLSTIPSCFLINCLSKDKHFMLHSVNLLSQAPLARWSCALPSVLFFYVFKKSKYTFIEKVP